MKKQVMLAAAFVGALGMLGGASSAHAEDGAKLFKKKCAMCHALQRKKVGPAIKQMTTDEAVLREVIANGRKMMPAFGKKLSAEQIDALVAYIRSQQAQ